MKKILLALGILLLSHYARAQETVLFNNLVTSGNYGCGTDAAGTFIPCNMSAGQIVSIQFTGIGGTGNATIIVWQRNTSGDGWSNVLQLSNPTVDQMGYYGIGIGQIYVQVTWNGGVPLRGTYVIKR